MNSQILGVDLRMATSAVWFCCIMLSATPQAQDRRTVDLRSQLVPVTQGQVDAARFSTMGSNDGVVTPFPLALTIQSVSPVSELNGKAIVELVVRNTSDANFRLPVSREMKILHADANADRRMLVCSMKLTHDVSREETIAVGSITFSSSGDPSSVLELRPKESILFRYEANFQLPWETDTAKWKDDMRKGLILAGVQCTQERFIRQPDAPRDSRVYGSERSQGVRSDNLVRLTVQP